MCFRVLFGVACLVVAVFFVGASADCQDAGSLAELHYCKAEVHFTEERYWDALFELKKAYAQKNEDQLILGALIEVYKALGDTKSVEVLTQSAELTRRRHASSADELSPYSDVGEKKDECDRRTMKTKSQFERTKSHLPMLHDLTAPLETHENTYSSVQCVADEPVDGHACLYKNVCLDGKDIIFHVPEGVDPETDPSIQQAYYYQNGVFDYLPNYFGFTKYHNLVFKHAPIGGPVNYVRGRTLWVENPLCSLGHSFEELAKTPFDRQHFPGTFEQVYFPMHLSPVCHYTYDLLRLTFEEENFNLPLVHGRTEQHMALDFWNQTRPLCFEEVMPTHISHRYVRSHAENDELRRKGWKMCGVPDPMLPPPNHGAKELDKVLDVLFFERSANRQIVNAPELCREVRENSKYFRARMHTESSDFCTDLAAFAHSDIVITKGGSHGFFVVWAKPLSVMLNVQSFNRYHPDLKNMATYASVRYLDYMIVDEAHSITTKKSQLLTPPQVEFCKLQDWASCVMFRQCSEHWYFDDNYLIPDYFHKLLLHGREIWNSDLLADCEVLRMDNEVWQENWQACEVPEAGLCDSDRTCALGTVIRQGMIGKLANFHSVPVHRKEQLDCLDLSKTG